MNDVEFRIVVRSPVALTLESVREVVGGARAKWRITRVGIVKIEANQFECKVGIDARDVNRDNHADLIEFRDTFLSLLSLIAMVPVRPLIKGTFTFPLGNSEFAQLSLGPMDYVFPETPIPSFRPLIDGFAFDSAYRDSIWFMWQAINSYEPVHRFLNLAIAYELLIGVDSPVQGSRPPRCNACGIETTNCQKCGNEIRLPFTLRERGEFIFSDAKLLAGFVEFRNRLFHGGLPGRGEEGLQQLSTLNTNLLVNVRNYLGRKVGLTEIAAADISQAVNVPDIFVTVFYKSNEEAQAPRS